MIRIERWSGGRRLLLAAGALGVVGAALTAVGIARDARRALFSYLFGWLFWSGLCVGALMVLATLHAARARWSTLLRRALETMAGGLPLLALLFAPIAVGVAPLFSWVRPESLPARIQRHVFATRAWLNVPFWTVRAVIYLALWCGVAEWLLRLSRRQDERASLELTLRQRQVAMIALPAVGLALSFSSLDWIMSHEPRWSSTIFGVYVFAGVFVAALGALAVASASANGPNLFGRFATWAHRLSLGRMLLGFTAFWAYVAFDQFMLVWIADIPTEVAWYRVRTSGGWQQVAWLVVLLRFVIPTLVLLSRDVKASRTGLAAIAVCVLLGHLVDIYWLVLPAVDSAAPHVVWTDLTAWVGVGGLLVAFVVWRLRGGYAVPVRDPHLLESLDYRHP